MGGYTGVGTCCRARIEGYKKGELRRPQYGYLLHRDFLLFYLQNLSQMFYIFSFRGDEILLGLFIIFKSFYRFIYFKTADKGDILANLPSCLRVCYSYPPVPIQSSVYDTGYCLPYFCVRVV